MIQTKIPPLPIYITSSKTVFKKGMQHFKRTFHIFDFIYVTKGTLYLKERDSFFSVKEGEYLIFVPGEEHGGFKPCEEETSYYWIHFNFSTDYSVVNEQSIDWSNIVRKKNTLTEPDEYELFFPQYGKIRSAEQFTDLIETLIRYNDVNDPSERMKKHSLFFDFLISLQKNALELPSSAQKVTELTLQYVQDHYSDPNFSIKDMSKKLLYHSDYITRTMKKTIGVTPNQYITQYRLSIVKKLLQEGKLDLHAIANEVGFYDASYLSRIFKKKEGVTPGQYRRMRQVL